LFLGNTHQNVGVKGHNVHNLLSNGSRKKNAYGNEHIYTGGDKANTAKC